MAKSPDLRCCAMIPRGKMFQTRCSFRGTVTRSGKRYCSWHDPERVAKRRAASRVKSLARADKFQKMQRLVYSAPSLLALHEAHVGHLTMLRMAIEADDPKKELLLRVDDMLAATRAALAKAKGET